MALEPYDEELAAIEYSAAENELIRNGNRNSITLGALIKKDTQARRQHEEAYEQQQADAEAAQVQTARETQWAEQCSQLNTEQIAKLQAAPEGERQGLVDGWLGVTPQAALSAAQPPSSTVSSSPAEQLGVALSRTSPAAERRQAASQYGLGLGAGVGLDGSLPAVLRKDPDNG
jgi:hypothetical protein